MALTTDEFESFAVFSRSRLANGGADLSLDDLVIAWESHQHRDEINAAISEGIEDAKAGRYRAADEVMVDLCKKHNLPTE
jgi:hypothetical protein